MQRLTLPEDQRCLYQHRSMVTCESPVTSTNSDPISNPILVRVSHTHTHTHTQTHIHTRTHPGCQKSLLSSCHPTVSSKAPLGIWYLFGGRFRSLGSFLSLPPTPAGFPQQVTSLPWDCMKSYGIYLAGFSDLFQRPRFLVYCSFNPLKAFGIFSSFPSPKVSIWSQAGLPQCLWGGGRDAETPGPSHCPFLHLCQGKDQCWADLSWPDQKRRLWKPARPHGCPALCGHSCLPSLPPACSFSQWSSMRLVPQRAAGNRGLSPALHWPRLPTLEHSGINGKQQDLSASPLSSGLWGPHSPRPSVPFHLSGQCCFLKPAILPPLSPPLPPPLLLRSHPSPPPTPSSSLSWPSPMKWVSLKRTLALLPHKAVLQPLWVLEFLLKKNFFFEVRVSCFETLWLSRMGGAILLIGMGVGRMEKPFSHAEREHGIIISVRFLLAGACLFQEGTWWSV